MGYELKADGLKDLNTMLDRLGDKALGVAARALYDGAGMMSAEVRKGAEGIKTAPFKYASRSRGEVRLPSPEEKEIVVAAGAGIAKFDKDPDGVQTSVGYSRAGYANLDGKVKPVPLIVNAINSGTSFLQKQPFIRKAGRAGSAKALKAMTDAIENDFNEIINNGGK